MLPNHLFATPVLWLPGQMNDEEFEFECQRMLFRAEVTAGWNRGEIDTETFQDVLNETGVDPHQAFRDWESGIRY